MGKSWKMWAQPLAFHGPGIFTVFLVLMRVILPQAASLGPVEHAQFCAQTGVLPSSGCTVCNPALSHRVALVDQPLVQSLR